MPNIENVLNILNVAECKELIKKYREVTIDDILEAKEYIGNEEAGIFPSVSIANKLTGFSNHETCPLCIKCIKCEWCIHLLNETKYRSCIEQTYYNIAYAVDEQQLLKAFRERADYLQKLVDLYDKLTKKV